MPIPYRHLAEPPAEPFTPRVACFEVSGLGWMYMALVAPTVVSECRFVMIDEPPARCAEVRAEMERALAARRPRLVLEDGTG